MNNRSFRVRINSVPSNSHILHNGILQSSPLSVVLFTILIEEINCIVNHISLYSNDAISTKIKNINTVLATFPNIGNNQEIKATSGAFLAIEKCQLLHICRKQRCNLSDIDFKSRTIKDVNFIKILGIAFDFISHISSSVHIRKFRSTSSN